MSLTLHFSCKSIGIDEKIQGLGSLSKTIVRFARKSKGSLVSLSCTLIPNFSSLCAFAREPRSEISLALIGAFRERKPGRGRGKSFDQKKKICVCEPIYNEIGRYVAVTEGQLHTKFQSSTSLGSPASTDRNLQKCVFLRVGG